MDQLRHWIETKTTQVEAWPMLVAPLALIALVLLYLLSRIPKLSRWLERNFNKMKATLRNFARNKHVQSVATELARWDKNNRFKRIAEAVLDWAEQELYAGIFTTLWTGFVVAYMLTNWGALANELIAEYIFANVMALFIFVLFPKSETEETVNEMIDLVDQSHTMNIANEDKLAEIDLKLNKLLEACTDAPGDLIQEITEECIAMVVTE